jgi:alginate O-acetyltransferase complex protein AlgI
MIFNSVIFGLFCPAVFIFYWVLGRNNKTVQNLILLIASYVFYGWWNWRFLSLIFITTLVTYIAGSQIGRTDKETQKSRRIGWLIVALLVNLSILGVFKYFNFFIESFAQILGWVGVSANLPTLRLILPLGISFFTFQSLTYPLDVYFERTKPIRNLLSYFAFIAFFPQLLAGPIGRASLLLPQFQEFRQFNRSKATDGLRQMLWGFFKKLVIADNLAPHVDRIFSNYQTLDGLTLALGVFFFAIEIYADFSGYSDIALGVANLFSISLMRNFAFPYFARDIGEFWRHWHISMTSWFRDYLYFRLGGLYGSKLRRIFNVVLTFTVSGLWHGANWTYIFWGFLNGLYFIPINLQNEPPHRSHFIAKGKLFPPLKEFGLVLITFTMTCFAWIFFRAPTLGDALKFIGRMFQTPWMNLDYAPFIVPLIWAVVLLSSEWLQRTRQHALEMKKKSLPFRWSVYVAIVAAIFLFGNFGSTEFIYFQF